MSRLVIFGAGGFGCDLLVAARAERRAVVLLDDAAVPDGLLPMIAHGDLRDDDRMVISVAEGRARQRIAARHRNFDRLVAPSAIVGTGTAGGGGGDRRGRDPV